MTARQTPTELLDELCQDGRMPGDRELALAQVVALAQIAESLRGIETYLEHIANAAVNR